MPTMLDPQDARPLTSREISKVLCGVIGSLVHYDFGIRHQLPGVLELVRKTPGDLEMLSWATGGRSKPASWATALGATVLGLRAWCGARDIQTALSWVSENLELICATTDSSDAVAVN